MANETPLNFEDFQRKCKVTTAPRLDEAKGEFGLRNINKDQLRCFLLQQKQESIGGSRAVLDLENWYDCRVQYPPDPNVIIAQALTDLGFVKSAADKARAGSMFDQIAADLEDSENSNEAGPLINLLRMVASMPREGTLDRAQFENIRRQAITVALPMAAKYLKKAVPGAKEAVDDGITVIKHLVDMAVATADYIIEYKAVRSEAAARIYSGNRHDYIEKAFEGQYGSKPASSTIAAWCHFGNDRVAKTGKPAAYLFAPDGTDGEALAAKAAYDAAMLMAGEEGGKLKARFGGNWRKFFGISGMIGSWVLAYRRDDVHPTAFDYQNADYARGYPGYGSNAILRYIGAAAMENVDAYELFQGDYEMPVQTARPAAVAWNNTNFGMALDAAPGEKPFASKVWWPSFDLNGQSPAVTAPQKVMLLKKATAFMWAAYMEGQKGTVIKQEDWFGKPTRKKLEKSPKLTNGFAVDVWTVWQFWMRYVENAVPFKGKMGKWAFLRDTVFAPNVDRFFGALDNQKVAGALDKMNWSERVVYALEGRVTASPRVEKRPPAPCPSGTTDCLPCGEIRDRLPIGANVIDIPMLIDYTGSNVWKSPEFKAWAKNLSDNGYPGYYIDCIARDVVFRSKATGQVVSSGSSKPAAYSAATYKASAATLKSSGTNYRPMAGADGLTAPWMAKLDSPDLLPIVPVPAFDELQGITRPLVAEWVRGK